jgi:hypothetical protein
MQRAGGEVRTTASTADRLASEVALGGKIEIFF